MDRETFKNNAKKSIDSIFAKIDELESKKDQAKSETKVEYEQMLQSLRSKKDRLIEQYDALANSSEGKWEEAKEAFSSASDSFKEGFSKISSLFR